MSQKTVKKRRYWLRHYHPNISKLERRIKKGRYKTPHALMTARNTIFKARLKNKPTAAERVFGDYLWSKEVKFVFQKGFFSPFHRIFDFYIPGMKRGFEIDGSSHIGKEEKDFNRDRWYFTARGIRTTRVTNSQVFSGEFRKIVDSILG